MTPELQNKVDAWIKENWHKMNTVWAPPIIRKEFGIHINDFYKRLKECDAGKKAGRKKDYKLKICTAQVIKGKFGSFDKEEE